MTPEAASQTAINQFTDSAISKTIKALSILSIDPANLRGAVLKSRSGPIRESLLALLPKLFLGSKFQKIYPSVTDAQLFGGIDFAHTFKTGKPVKTKGLLNTGNATILLSMANFIELNLIGKYASAIDNKPTLCFIASDEGLEDEPFAEALLDRLAFSVTTEGTHFTRKKEITFDYQRIAAARHRLHMIPITDETINTFTLMATKLGIGSLRSPILACYAARAAAAFSGNVQIRDEHILEVAQLVFSHRATVIPQEDDLEDTNADSSSNNHNESKDHQDIQETAMPLEMILDAIKSNLSPEALKALIAKTKISSLRQNTSGFGQKKYSNRRGRPLPSRVGSLDSGKRLDIIETLKAAAPWQTIRRTGASLDQFKVLIRKSDLRVKRYEEKSDRLIIFTVDASGTSALGRLGETKGAIEILLSEAYARRDQVALISFRGEQATLELPPTRSLVQTKRRLAGLPGGGTTPLAAALSESYKLAIQARSKGMTPTLALLTDGKGNIALDGSADRKTAETDMGNLAALIRSAHIPSIVVDTSRRPQMPAQSLSQNLSATYIALPYADSKKLYSAVSKVIT